MNIWEMLLHLLLLLALFASWAIFSHSVLVLRNCTITIASFILIVVSLVALSLTESPLRLLEERSKVAGILIYSIVFIFGLVMVVAILHGVITNYQPEIPRFLLACILRKSPQDNGTLTLFVFVNALIAMVFFAIMALYGAFSLVKLILSRS